VAKKKIPSPAGNRILVVSEVFIFHGPGSVCQSVMCFGLCCAINSRVRAFNAITCVSGCLDVCQCSSEHL